MDMFSISSTFSATTFARDGTVQVPGQNLSHIRILSLPKSFLPFSFILSGKIPEHIWKMLSAGCGIVCGKFILNKGVAASCVSRYSEQIPSILVACRLSGMIFQTGSDLYHSFCVLFFCKMELLFFYLLLRRTARFCVFSLAFASSFSNALTISFTILQRTTSRLVREMVAMSSTFFKIDGTFLKSGIRLLGKVDLGHVTGEDHLGAQRQYVSMPFSK